MFTNIIICASAVLILLLGFLVLKSDPANRANRAMFGFSGFVALWSIANFMTNISATADWALVWAKIAIIGPVMFMYFFLLFADNFPDPRPWRRVELLYLLPPLLFAVLAPTELNVVSSGPYGEGLISGPLYALLMVYSPVYLIWALIKLIRKTKTSQSALVRSQLRLIFIGMGISFIPGYILNGVLVFMNISQFASIGPLTVLIFVLITAYAMMRYQLMSVRAIVARSVAYALLFLILVFLYVFGATLVGRLVFDGDQLTFTNQILDIILVSTLVFAFQPLRCLLERITDSMFYKNGYDAQQVLRVISEVIVSDTDTGKLVGKAVSSLCKNMHIQTGKVIIVSRNGEETTASFGNGFDKVTAEEAKHLGKSLLVASNLRPGAHLNLMESLGIAVSAPLVVGDGALGLVLLGQKLSGDPYVKKDIEVIEIACRALGLAVQNAKAFSEIQEFNETLQDRVARATRRLRKANEHLRELDVAKDEFISMASHQLRTPLTTIKGYLSMLEDGDVGDITKEQREYVDYAFTSSERMAHLISDLLNASRLTTGKFTIDYEPVDLVDLVADEVRQLLAQANAKGLKLTFNRPATELPMIEMDNAKTRQVVMNFIDNAIHYTPSGHIDVNLERIKDKVRFTVTDTGIGVPEEAKKKVFEKFFRASNAQATRPDGTGLGVFLAKRVVEDQGGTIIFESKVGKGSTFGFTIPIKSKKVRHDGQEQTGSHR